MWFHSNLRTNILNIFQSSSFPVRTEYNVDGDIPVWFITGDSGFTIWILRPYWNKTTVGFFPLFLAMWLDYWSTSIDFARNSFDIVECRNALTCSYYVLWFYDLFVFSFLAMVFLACFLRFTYREKISFSYLGTTFHNLCEKFFNSFIATDTIFGLAVSSLSTLIGVKSDFSLMGAQCIWASWLQKGQWGSDIYIFRNKPGIVTDILESSCFHRYIFKNQFFSDFFF